MKCREELSRYIGNRCHSFRIRQGFPASKIAAALGISSNAVTAFERGENISGVILCAYIAEGAPFMSDAQEDIRNIIKGGSDE